MIFRRGGSVGRVSGRRRCPKTEVFQYLPYYLLVSDKADDFHHTSDNTEDLSHRFFVIVHPPLNPLPRGDSLYSPSGREQGWVLLLSSKGEAELLLLFKMKLLKSR